MSLSKKQLDAPDSEAFHGLRHEDAGGPGTPRLSHPLPLRIRRDRRRSAHGPAHPKGCHAASQGNRKACAMASAPRGGSFSFAGGIRALYVCGLLPGRLSIPAGVAVKSEKNRRRTGRDRSESYRDGPSFPGDDPSLRGRLDPRTHRGERPANPQGTIRTYLGDPSRSRCRLAR